MAFLATGSVSVLPASDWADCVDCVDSEDSTDSVDVMGQAAGELNVTITMELLQEEIIIEKYHKEHETKRWLHGRIKFDFGTL